MTATGDPPSSYVAPWSRVAILLGALGVACVLSLLITGSIVPSRPEESLIFQSGLLLVVLGSAVLEHKFTRPADSVVNGLMGIVTLTTVYAVAPRRPWLVVFSYCAVVFALALLCTVVSTQKEITGWRRVVARLTYQPAVFFGRARVLYSVVFLFGIFSFFDLAAPETAILICFWGLFLALWPLQLPQFLSGLRLSPRGPRPIGEVVRREWPNLVRVELEPATAWSQDQPRLYQDADGIQHSLIPLYKQSRDEKALGTGLSVQYSREPMAHLTPGLVYELPGNAGVSEEEIAESLGASANSRLVGFVIEDSEIGAIRFETWRPDLCDEGLLVWCRVGDAKVFYQITEGATREENLQSDRHGFQYAVASQLGRLDPEAGFVKFGWLPTMNTPVFCESEKFGVNSGTLNEGDFCYGTVPGTKIEIGGPFTEFLDYHTAILGVTGSGKTELGFDLIRHALAAGVKVICIDLTARYEERLNDLGHRNLSISADLSEELGKKLFDAETGAYGAPNEKKALKEFRDKLREDVSKTVQDFLSSAEADEMLGIITLDEISNTKATLFITELYMTCLLHHARDNPKDCPRVLVVVEEAHTVMPEASTMGLGDYDSRGLVSKISQIALQGRKYGVGLLVIAQRTATVSKTVLTQCNTMITLNCFDETSLGFLSNVYGASHARSVANLPKLHAVVFGKAVRSERPIIVEIPFDATKTGA